MTTVSIDFDMETLHSIVRKDLTWHYNNFGKKQKVPFESYDKAVEAAYVKEMRQALKRVLKYYGKEVK